MRTPLIALFSIFALSCAARDLDWEIVFESTSLEMQARRLDARILRGACPGTETLWEAVVHPARPDDPPTLPEGTYCFAAQAGNAACEWIARGERTVELPTDEMVTITLAMQAADSNCPSGMCNADGTCGSDPGTPPTTCPLGMCDQTCTDDCTAVCEGGGCTQTCRGGATVECDFTCPGGNCTVVCEDSADCTADCVGGDCSMSCRGAITDCVFGCLGGGCNFDCEDPGNCTTSCSSSCSGP